MEGNILWKGKANTDFIFSARRHDHYDHNASYIIYWLLIFHTKENNRVEHCNLRGLIVQIFAHILFQRTKVLDLNRNVYTSLTHYNFHPQSARAFICSDRKWRTWQKPCPFSSLVSHSLWAPHQQSGATLTNPPFITELPTYKQTMI